MQARICRLHGKGDLRIEVEIVPEPAPDEVLVRLVTGGICGSDLHFFHDGGIGTVRVREPLILGHEVAGMIEQVGSEVNHLRPGDRVAINPSRPCGRCKFCLNDQHQHCLSMKFFGAAMLFPHTQGAFREHMTVKAGQCVPIADQVTFGEAACAEPLAVCLHARSRAGNLVGKTVLVTGAGPIGALMCAVARHGGAARVIATDLFDHPLSVTARMGADETINVAQDDDAVQTLQEDKGLVDVTFECSGAAPAIETAIHATRPEGRIVLVGMAGALPIPINLIVSKELECVGTQRFHAEYAEAVDLINQGAVDVTPIISATRPLDGAVDAFHLASDRRQAVKVQLNLSD